MPTRFNLFDSPLLQDFAVVEEVDEEERRYPATAQLPKLHRALDLEFKVKMPGYIARVDHRADGFRKLLLRHAAIAFCNLVNGHRRDGLLLFPNTDNDMVTHISIAQHIQAHLSGGVVHGFRFFAGEGFYTEIYLSGKRLYFTDHAYQRLNARTSGFMDSGLGDLLTAFFDAQYLQLQYNNRPTFFLPYSESLLAAPFTEFSEAFLVLTVLGVNEINYFPEHLSSLKIHNLAYDLRFPAPTLRHCSPFKQIAGLQYRWSCRRPYVPMLPHINRRWMQIADIIKPGAIKQGHGVGSEMRFLDDVPGPCVIMLRPNEQAPLKSESQFIDEYLARQGRNL